MSTALERPPFWLDSGMRKMIRFKASRLVGSYGYTAADCEDLQQEAALALHQRFRRYDSMRSSHRTFAQRVVNHHFANLIAERRAGRRDYRACMRSLEEPDGQDRRTCFGETLSGDDYQSRMRRQSMLWPRRLELQADVERAIASMQTELASVARLLMSMNVSDVARHLKLSRATVHRRIGDIRAVFAAAELRQVCLAGTCCADAPASTF